MQFKYSSALEVAAVLPSQVSFAAIVMFANNNRPSLFPLFEFYDVQRLFSIFHPMFSFFPLGFSLYLSQFLLGIFSLRKNKNFDTYIKYQIRIDCITYPTLQSAGVPLQCRLTAEFRSSNSAKKYPKNIILDEKQNI